MPMHWDDDEEKYYCDVHEIWSDDEICKLCEKAPVVEGDPAKPAFEELLKHFSSLTPDALSSLAVSMAGQLKFETEKTLRNELTKPMREQCGEQVKEVAAANMKEIVEILASRMVVAGSKFSCKEMMIKDVIYDQFEDALSKLKEQYGSRDYVKKIIDEYITKEVKAMVNKAIVDLKQDLLTKLEKETVGRLTKAIASAIASDKKLLAVIRNSEL